MTTRESFAAAALTGILAGRGFSRTSLPELAELADEIAVCAYDLADAMMDEGAKRSERRLARALLREDGEWNE